MKKFIASFLIAGFFGLALMLPGHAEPLPAYTVHIVIKNWSPNGAWMTAYMRDGGKDSIVGAWCVGPNEEIDRTFGKGRGPYKVIAEITPKPNCHGGTIKRLAQDTGFRYQSTNYFFHKLIRGRGASADW